MPLSRCQRVAIVWIVANGAFAANVWAGKPGFRNVPPTLEIEILDPGVDPLGNPAVVLRKGEYGDLTVDIPPVVLVHRFYYTGDRTFQAQILPGGPSIVVASHPKTGERCYIPVQMLPGAPRVTYTAHAIKYDYGPNGIAVEFGLFGQPSVKYRNGYTWSQKAANLVHAEQLRDKVKQKAARSKEAAKQAGTAAYGAIVGISSATKIVTVPLKNVVRVLPFGAAILSPDTKGQLIQRAEQHKREKQARHFEKQQALNNLDFPTNR